MDICKLDIEFNKIKENKKIKITPFGEIVGFDKRVFIVNDTTIKNTLDIGLSIPLNVEHSFTSKYNGEAVGWIDVKSLEVVDGYVVGNVELNKKGKELLDEKAYKYLSPEFIINEKREVVRIVGLALTNEPNFKLEINKQKNQTKETNMDEALKKEVNELKTQNDSLKKEVNRLQDELSKKDESIKALMFDNALALNKVVPAEKEFCMSLNVEQLQKYLNTKEPHSLNKDLNIQTNEQKEDNSLLKDLGWEA